jgi:hypothetical protein
MLGYFSLKKHFHLLGAVILFVFTFAWIACTTDIFSSLSDVQHASVVDMEHNNADHNVCSSHIYQIASRHEDGHGSVDLDFTNLSTSNFYTYFPFKDLGSFEGTDLFSETSNRRDLFLKNTVLLL